MSDLPKDPEARQMLLSEFIDLQKSETWEVISGRIDRQHKQALSELQTADNITAIYRAQGKIAGLKRIAQLLDEIKSELKNP